MPCHGRMCMQRMFIHFDDRSQQKKKKMLCSSQHSPLSNWSCHARHIHANQHLTIVHDESQLMQIAKTNEHIKNEINKLKGKKMKMEMEIERERG